MRIGNKDFDLAHHCYVMGILNVTPDSFSDGGRWNSIDAALKHTEEMAAEGCDILDIGGESTRPGYTRISDEEEIGRVAPVIEAVKNHFDIPISLDTYKSKVALAGIQAGADLINDIWGCKADPDMARVIAASGAACCLMHNRPEIRYGNFLADVQDDLRECVRIAKEAGIRDDRIILDPGLGFAKTYENNMTLMNHLELLNGLGYPILLGTSRKSMIGRTLDLPSSERLEGTLVTTVMGIMKGVSIVRVHDVKANKRAIAMTEGILRY